MFKYEKGASEAGEKQKKLEHSSRVDPCCTKEPKASDRMTPASCFSGQQNHVNGEVPHSPAKPQT